MYGYHRPPRPPARQYTPYPHPYQGAYPAPYPGYCQVPCGDPCHGPCDPFRNPCDPCRDPCGPSCDGPTGPTGPAGTGGLTNLVDGDNTGAVRGINTRSGYTMGENAVALGSDTEASGYASFAVGIRPRATGGASVAEGYDTVSTALASHAEGNAAKATGEASHAEGGSNASGFYSHAEGLQSNAQGDESHAEGNRTTASGPASHAEGFGTAASGETAHAEGYLTRASGAFSHAQGIGTAASGIFSHAEGLLTSDGGHFGVHIMGSFGTADTPGSWFLANGPVFGSGLAAKILRDGNAYIDVAWNGGGADYAEMYETESGQPLSPGCFVTFAGASDKIRLAQSYDSYVLGVVSRTPGFVAGAGELRWKGMYKTDEWGGLLYEDVPVAEVKDDAGHVTVPAHTERKPALNPAYDSNQTYVSRLKRPEWVKVALLGAVLVRDDGTLTPGGYCRPFMNGVATAAHDGYRVLKRTGANQALILFR